MLTSLFSRKYVKRTIEPSSSTATRNSKLKKAVLAGGRGQKVLFTYRIQTPPEKETPNFQFGGGLKPLLESVRADGSGFSVKGFIPSALCAGAFLR
jgi:hypothetical protein